MSPPPPAGFAAAGRPGRSAAAKVILLLLLVVCAPFLAACGESPATPEELFEEGCRLTNEGRHSAFFDLLSTEQRKDVIDRIEAMRSTVERNPGTKKLVENYWRVSVDEFRTLPYPELWQRAHQGSERVLVGAKILDKSVDPVNGRDVVITFETTAGQRFKWIMRHEPGIGWRFQQQLPVKLE
jgi:hypothetical protein